MNGLNLKDYELESGKLQAYAWPGGYPMYYVTADNGVLCPKCANENRALLSDPDDKQWHVVAAGVNYEDHDLSCDNCNDKVEAAYGDALKDALKQLTPERYQAIREAYYKAAEGAHALRDALRRVKDDYAALATEFRIAERAMLELGASELGRVL